MISLASYIGLEVLHASTNYGLNKHWFSRKNADSILIAINSGKTQNPLNISIEQRLKYVSNLKPRKVSIIEKNI